MTPIAEHGHVEPVRVYFDDLDAMGVLYNMKYGQLVERALTTYWERRGWNFDPHAPHFADIFFVVREFSITFRAPIVTVGEVQVHFWLDELGTSSATYGFRVLSADGSVVHAEGQRAQVKLDPATLRPAPIPPAVLEAVQPLLGPSLQARAAS
ncbi:MAG TPA: thioesterase family protein [Jatrophihabitantaceae bacterium]|nr:thioesterase family protein [Jatrophihabitantaceae bacterium]